MCVRCSYNLLNITDHTHEKLPDVFIDNDVNFE